MVNVAILAASLTLASLFLILTSIPAFAQYGVVDDTTTDVTSDTHLGEITVNQGESLRIQPGVQASFDRITNDGKVVIMGTLSGQNASIINRGEIIVEHDSFSCEGCDGSISLSGGAVSNEGSWQNHGVTLFKDMNVTSSGEIRLLGFQNNRFIVDEGTTFVNDGGKIWNYGRFEVYSSTIENRNGGQLTIPYDSYFLVVGRSDGNDDGEEPAVFNNREGSTVTNNHYFTINEGSTFNNYGIFENTRVFIGEGVWSAAELQNYGRFERHCGDSFSNSGLVTGKQLSDSCDTRPEEEEEEDDRYHVTIIEYSYGPRTATVHVGDTVVWKNADGTTIHTATAENGEFGVTDDGPALILPNQEFEHTFEKEGTFNYYCALHPDKTGTVIVYPPLSEPEPAPEPETETEQEEEESESESEPQIPAGALVIPEGSAVQGNASFTPDPFNVPYGEHMVTVFNADSVPHTVTSGSLNDSDAGTLFDTELMAPGTKMILDLTHLSAGDYSYFCTLHPHQTGTIRIAEGDEPATAVPADDPSQQEEGVDDDGEEEPAQDLPTDVPALSISQSGQSVTLSIALNYTSTATPFAAVIEIRDTNEHTQYLTWLTGTLEPGDDISVNTLWTPNTPGEYTLRGFVISSVESPIVALTQVAQIQFSVDSETLPVS